MFPSFGSARLSVGGQVYVYTKEARGPGETLLKRVEADLTNWLPSWLVVQGFLPREIV